MSRLLLLWIIVPLVMTLGTESRALSNNYGVNHHPIKNFFVKIETCLFQAQPLLSLRAFQRDKQNLRLLVDEQTLQTQILNAEDLTHCKPVTLWGSSLSTKARSQTHQFRPAVTETESSPDSADESTALMNSPYRRSLQQFNHYNGQLQGAGIQSDANRPEGSFITFDLCPSTKPLDKNYFELFERNKWPLAISVSGRWITHHREEWLWLQNKTNAQNRIWVTHSMTHPYHPALPLEKNFLLSEGVDIQSEILNLEKMLLDDGLIPSVFFRFPGLIADEAALNTLSALGLVALNSNAWLGKGQKPKKGSIVLLHGNGNDPKGLSLFDQYRDQNRLVQPFRDLFSLFSVE